MTDEATHSGFEHVRTTSSDLLHRTRQADLFDFTNLHPDLAINTSDFWTFPQDRDATKQRAAEHNAELSQ